MTLGFALRALGWLVVVPLLLAVVAVAALLGGPFVAFCVALWFTALVLESWWLAYCTPTARKASR
jgi:hypothetical protein